MEGDSEDGVGGARFIGKLRGSGQGRAPTGFTQRRGGNARKARREMQEVVS